MYAVEIRSIPPMIISVQSSPPSAHRHSIAHSHATVIINRSRRASPARIALHLQIPICI